MEQEIDKTTLLAQVCEQVHNKQVAAHNMDPFKEPLPEWKDLTGDQKFRILGSVLPYFNTTYEILKEAMPDPMDSYLKGYNDAKAEESPNGD